MATPERLRSDAGRGKIATIAGVVLMLIASLVAFSPIADAEVTATYKGMHLSANVWGKAGSLEFSNQGAGLMKVTLSGGQTAYVYCIDISHSIGPNQTVVESDWASAGIQNDGVILYILDAFREGESGWNALSTLHPKPSDGEKAAGIQAAIWNKSDNFVLDETRTPDAIVAVYKHVLNAATNSAPEPAATLNIEAPSQAEFLDDGIAGPFKITSNGTPTISIVGGKFVVWPTGEDIQGAPGVGVEFGVKPTTSGSSTTTINASVSAQVRAGQIFKAPGIQSLILATHATATSEKSASVTWKPAPKVGQLEITKLVVGSYLADGTALDPNTTYIIEVFGPGSSNAKVATETLTAGASKTISNLTPGTYKIVETAPTGVKTVTYSTTEDGNGKAQVEKSKTASLTVTNTYFNGPQPSARLKASCDVAPQGTLKNEGDVPVTFTVKYWPATGDPVVVEVPVSAGGSTTLSSIPSGTVRIEVYALGNLVKEKGYDPEDCLEVATPVDPVVVVSDTCDVPGTVAFTPVEGLIYLLDGEEVSGTLNGPVSGKVTAQAKSGWKLAYPDWSQQIAVAGAVNCNEVSPATPAVNPPSCEVPGSVEVPADSDEVTYTLSEDGKTVTASLKNPKSMKWGSHEGWSRNNDGDLTRTFELEDQLDCAETLVQPTVDKSTECEVGDSFTPPENTEGITYRYEGDTEGPGSGVLTAVPSPGYTLSAGDIEGWSYNEELQTWSYEIELKAGADCTVVTTPTTAPEASTTTTVPESTTTTIEEVGGIDEENTTTTAPEVKDQQVTPTTVGRRLPRTGSNSTTTLSLAGVLMTAGAALVVYGRRRQTA